MSRSFRALAMASTLALVLTTSTAARAQNVAADALFVEGRALFDKGRYEEAADRFARSQELDPAFGTLMNLGDSYERLGKVASAWGAYREALGMAAAQKNPQRITQARNASVTVERRVPRLTVDVDRRIAGLSVTRNGIKIEAAALGAPIPVDPGGQAIVVTAPDRQPWQTTVQVREGESRTVQVPVLEPRPGEATTTPPPIGAPPPPPDSRTQARVALGLEIGGGVVLGAGLIFGALAISRWSSVTDTCPDARCANEADRTRREGDASTATTFATVSTIASSVGLAALVTGIVLHLTAPERRVSLAPTVDRTGGGFLATLRL